MKRKTIIVLGALFISVLALQPAYSGMNEKIQLPGASDEQLTEKIRIFPNPTDGRFQIRMDLEMHDQIVAKVYDITGKLIKDLSDDLVKTDSEISADVDLDHPKSGMYFLRVEMGKKIATLKIVVK
jgi:hypothetical protein